MVLFINNKGMFRYISYLITGIIISFYFFPIGFTFLPSGTNTKMILAVIGVVLSAYECLRRQSIIIPKGLLVATFIAVIFSLICFYSTDINHTTDYAYANYIISFCVWLGGAYTVCSIIRCTHGYVNFRLLTIYLTAVCFSQCISAMMIDNIPALKLFLDAYVDQGQKFFEEVDRLYGIGAALDPAGIRFSLVLVMIAGLLSHDETVRRSSSYIVSLLVAFFVIVIIGNAISRTTILGLVASVIYFIISSGIFRVVIKDNSIKLWFLFSTLFIIAIITSIYLYNQNGDFHKQMRFAFEGFFNFFEQGEWRTSSTDKLNREMWIWPEDQKTWLIGSGLFDNFIYNTDIGYCRFILYCGLIGFTIFALLFIYLGGMFSCQYPKYKIMFIIFTLLAFVFWFKVATDIFFLYALFLCLDQFTLSIENESSK